jgi:hypothetical protein
LESLSSPSLPYPNWFWQEVKQKNNLLGRNKSTQRFKYDVNRETSQNFSTRNDTYNKNKGRSGNRERKNIKSYFRYQVPKH